jgi:hypothetical protein
VSFYVADQTYEWVGMKKRGRRNTLERLDPAGMPVAIEHEVYINSVKLELPQSRHPPTGDSSADQAGN